MTDEKIAIGDVVKLKSGGPDMTVAGILPPSEYRPEPQWTCYWFGDGDVLCQAQFVTGVLEKR